MWEWKVIDTNNNKSLVRSDFEVGKDGANTGGLPMRLTLTFTAGGLAVPFYLSASRLPEEELLSELCPDGVLAAKVPGLCKGGDDIDNKGFGMLVLLRADRKDPSKELNAPRLTIANKKFIY